MRILNPIYLAAAVAIALAGPVASAQTTGGTLRVAPTGTTATTSTSTTGTPSGSTTPTPGVTAESSASGASLRETPVQSAGGTGSAMGTNQTTVDSATTRPGSFEPGGAFGPAGTTAEGTTTAPATPNGTTGVLIPGDTGFAGIPSQQNIVIQQQPAPQPEVRTLSTPLLDQTTREAQARETRRRNAKQEPRIIGIAPNTDRDLTHQLPDDPIIRY